VIAFMRHVGCPFAEATARAMCAAAAEAPPEVEWVAVTHSSPSVTLGWCARVGGCDGLRLVEDESRALYASWGLGRTGLRHFAGLRSLREVLRLRAEDGIQNTASDGTRWQTAGTFALDPGGTLRWRHVPRHAGELPDLGEAVRALELRGPLRA
jgi:AhpC/TSA antioxidant enzyme